MNHRVALTAMVVVASSASALSGCASSNPASLASTGDCTIALSFDGHRYSIHTGLDNPRVGRSLGMADEVGCDSDPTVYGTSKIYAIAGISSTVAIAVVGVEDGDRQVGTYLRDDQSRDRAPANWPGPIAPGAFE